MINNATKFVKGERVAFDKHFVIASLCKESAENMVSRLMGVNLLLGKLGVAHSLFNSLLTHDLIPWTSLTCMCLTSGFLLESEEVTVCYREPVTDCLVFSRLESILKKYWIKGKCMTLQAAHT